MIGAVIFLFGLVVGSFLNVVICRLYSGQSLIWPGSTCPNCKKPIAWYDNIPLFSFVWLEGKCRHCRKKISWQYPAVEFVTALIFVWLYLIFGLSIQLPFLMIFSSFLVVIFIHDFKHCVILDKVTIPAMVFALVANLYLGYAWSDLLLGAIIGGGFFGLQYFLSKGKWIGDGDIRLGVVMGLMLGWQLLIVALFLAYLVGAIFGTLLIILGKKKISSTIPFGTFLSLATFFTFLYGWQILGWYIGFFK